MVKGSKGDKVHRFFDGTAGSDGGRSKGGCYVWSMQGRNEKRLCQTYQHYFTLGRYVHFTLGRYVLLGCRNEKG